MSELALRILFSVVAAPLALFVVLAGGAPLAALLAVVSALGAWEFYRIARGSGNRPLDDVGIAIAGLVPLAVHAHYLGLVGFHLALASVLALAILAATIWLRGVDGRPLAAPGHPRRSRHRRSSVHHRIHPAGHRPRQHGHG
jgi:CDP-diglyceride synthetase